MIPCMPPIRIDPQTLLAAYSQGVFPMADHDGIIRWYSADPRGVLPMDAFHVPHSLAQTVRQNKFEVRVNHDFRATMRACMENREDGTWINDRLILAYTKLHEIGHAHSVECYRNGELAGGLYGVSLGAAFFGESMFHRQRDASKVALVHLVRRLRERNFVLLDTQAVTTHLQRFGAIEISADEYARRLKVALRGQSEFD